MSSFYRFICSVFTLILFTVSVKSADVSQQFAEKLQKDFQNVSLNPDENKEIHQEIVNSSVRLFNLVEAWPKNQQIPQELLKGAAEGFGQLAYISPYTLQYY